MRIERADGKAAEWKCSGDRMLAGARRQWTIRATAAAFLVLSAPLPAQQVAGNTLSDGPSPQMQAKLPIDQAPVAGLTQAPATGGSISGFVVDLTGAAITSATVTLTFHGAANTFETKTDGGGGFSFPSSSGGAFVISVSAPGFMAGSAAGSVSAGQVLNLPSIALGAGSSTEVNVGVTQAEMAQEQLNIETKQRLLGVIPNYYMSYDPHPLPLTSKQKFELAGRFMLDPVSFGLTGLTAGVQQANDDYKGFGHGASGYGKRYAASTGALLNGAVIGGALLPSLLHQDPRYFYKGTGSVKSRTLYAVANTVICKGDNGHWQFNVSSIGGGFAAGAISNFYYPAADRDGVRSTLTNFAIGIVEEAAENIGQEFLFRRFTSHAKRPKTEP